MSYGWICKLKTEWCEQGWEKKSISAEGIETWKTRN